MPTYAGFVAGDFAAYAPAKWKSNVFNRDRLEVKQKLLLLAAEAGSHLCASDGAPLAVEASVEHPALWNRKQVDAQHVFFSRNQEARRELDRIIDRERGMKAVLDDPTPQRTHIHLCLSLDETGLEAGLKLHPDARIDRENLERKCEDPYERTRLVELLRRLGDGFEVGGAAGERGLSGSIDEDGLRGLLTRFAAGKDLLFVGRRIQRDVAVAEGAALAETTRRTLAAVLPAFHFAAWTRQNDFLAMRQALQKEKEAQKQRGLAKLDRVRIVRGVLSGKQGVVQEIDARGALKVLVGKLAIKLGAEDVVKQ